MIEEKNLHNSKYDSRLRVISGLAAIMTCRSEIEALKSPFIKGDLGGF